jgi:Lon protease-like protein
VSTALPLFPLGTVLFPGLLLPLRVFEPRYVSLLRRLTDLPEGTPREFGVVAIRRGWEVASGAPGTLGTLVATEEPVLYEIGCAAELRQVTEEPEGQFAIVVVGRRRFRVLGYERGSTPYLVATVEWLAEPAGGERVEAMAASVLAEFRRYLRLLRPQRQDLPDEQLPDDPTVLSHLVAASASLAVDERQALLAEPDTLSRLRAELTLLRRETTLFVRVRAVPAPLTELSTPQAPN